MPRQNNRIRKKMEVQIQQQKVADSYIRKKTERKRERTTRTRREKTAKCRKLQIPVNRNPKTKQMETIQ